MSAKHTPGPWIVESDGSMLEVWEEETLYTVARVFRHEQNARLIAAAPELLEACLTLIQTDDLQAAIDKARAAIAKATGSAA